MVRINPINQLWPEHPQYAETFQVEPVKDTLNFRALNTGGGPGCKNKLLREIQRALQMEYLWQLYPELRGLFWSQYRGRREALESHLKSGFSDYPKLRHSLDNLDLMEWGWVHEATNKDLIAKVKFKFVLWISSNILNNQRTNTKPTARQRLQWSKTSCRGWTNPISALTSGGSVVRNRDTHKKV